MVVQQQQRIQSTRESATYEERPGGHEMAVGGRASMIGICRLPLPFQRCSHHLPLRLRWEGCDDDKQMPMGDTPSQQHPERRHIQVMMTGVVLALPLAKLLLARASTS